MGVPWGGAERERSGGRTAAGAADNSWVKTRTKVGLVAAGWVAAIVAGFVAAWLDDLRVRALPYDTSGGMYAGGEMLAGLAGFLIIGLVPVFLTLWFLRRNHPFWNGLAVASVAFAAVGLLAVVTTRAIVPSSGAGGVLLGLLGLAQLLGVPLWLFGCALFAFLAPTRFARRSLVAAAAIEAIVGVLAFVHWFVPRPPV